MHRKIWLANRDNPFIEPYDYYYRWREESCVLAEQPMEKVIQTVWSEFLKENNGKNPNIDLTPEDLFEGYCIDCFNPHYCGKYAAYFAKKMKSGNMDAEQVRAYLNYISDTISNFTHDPYYFKSQLQPLYEQTDILWELFRNARNINDKESGYIQKSILYILYQLREPIYKLEIASKRIDWSRHNDDFKYASPLFKIDRDYVDYPNRRMIRVIDWRALGILDAIIRNSSCDTERCELLEFLVYHKKAYQYRTITAKMMRKYSDEAISIRLVYAVLCDPKIINLDIKLAFLTILIKNRDDENLYTPDLQSRMLEQLNITKEELKTFSSFYHLFRNKIPLLQ